MKRGELYRVYRGSRHDPKDHRVFLIVSRQEAVDSGFSTVICAPVYTNYRGFSTQVEVGVENGLKHDSAVYCDELAGIPKSKLTDYVGALKSYFGSLSGLFRHLVGGTQYFLSLFKGAMGSNAAALRAIASVESLPRPAEGKLSEAQWKELGSALETVDAANTPLTAPSMVSHAYLCIYHLG